MHKKQYVSQTLKLNTMSSYLKSVKKSTMTDEMRRSLCEHHKKNPSSTQKDLQQWVKTMFDLQVSQATISNTIKRLSEYLSTAIEKGDAK